MIKYPISGNYLLHWSLMKGLKEFLQNAIDSDSEFSVVYDNNTKVLRITNDGILESSSLLLGSSTKANDDSKIGNYGEGYKMGSLVCCRNDKEVHIQSGDGQCYDFSLTFDDLWNTSVLTVEVYDVSNYTPNKVIVEISNITNGEYDELQSLYLHGDYAKILTNSGEILLDGKFANKVFVNGLYIADSKELKYGYNFRSCDMELDRDRNTFDNWNAKYYSSAMWGLCSDEHTDEIIKMLEDNNVDVEYINSHLSVECGKKLSDSLYEHHKSQRRGLPVSSNSDVTRYNAGAYSGSYYYGSSTYSSVIRRSSMFVEPKLESFSYRKNMKPKEIINLFMFRNREGINSNKIVAELSQIVEISKNWRYKPNKEE